MKYHLLLILVLSGLNSQGQDTTKHTGSRSVSFTAGANITNPRSNQFMNGSNLIVYPTTGAGAWFEINTDKAFKQTDYSSFGISYGIGFTEYTYKGIADDINDMRPDVGPVATLQKAYEAEANIGFFINEKITKKINWYSKIGFLLSASVYNLYVPAWGPNPDPWSLPPYGALLNLTTQETANIYMLYQTGIAIALNKHFTITPTIEIPFVNLTSRSLGWSSALNDIFNNPSDTPDLYSPYNSFRAGVTLTYTFKKAHS
jgi:hypothetical protein